MSQAVTHAPVFGESAKIERFFTAVQPGSPCLVVDLDIVADRYRALAQAFPDTGIFYAVKANPAREIIGLLAGLGASFDVASATEAALCLDCGVPPCRLSYGNTIKKERDIAWAHERGVDLFAFDAEEELYKIARAAPGARVLCRLLADNSGAQIPLSRKFGCDPEMAVRLLRKAPALGLQPWGLCFHVGSQQTSMAVWDGAIMMAAHVAETLRRAGVDMPVLNVGGGFPGSYREPVPAIGRYAGVIAESVARHFGAAAPRLMLEPGRYVVADAGVLRSEVILVARKSDDDPVRWVYLDVGRFGGLAETEGEAIRYILRTEKDGGPSGPVVIAGPTCDTVDILYERSGYELPLDLAAGDKVHFLAAGAYTTTYASQGFNGFAPLDEYYI